MEPSALWLRAVVSPPLTRLAKLDLSSSRVNLTGRVLGGLLEPLARGASVRELNLSGLPLQDLGASSVAQLLACPTCCLEQLDVSGIYIYRYAYIYVYIDIYI